MTTLHTTLLDEPITERRHLAIRFPLMSACLTIVVLILSIALSTSLFSAVFPEDSEFAGSIARLVCTSLLLVLTVKSGITPPTLFIPRLAGSIKQNWPVVTMTAIAAMNLLFIEWHAHEYALTNALDWFFAAFATGVFEEGMMRAIIFMIMWKAWEKHQHGLLLAALVQATLFGLLHLLNIGTIPTGALIAQIGYAIFLGFGFAGITVLTKSIWPAVFVHMLINLLGSLNQFFISGYEELPEATLVYVLLCGAIFLLAALPGFWSLKQSTSSMNDF